MTPIALIDQKAILLDIKEIVDNVLGITHYQPITWGLAEAIVKITGNSGLCYVQFPSEDCPEITVPLLWKYSAWATAVERQRQSKLQAERDRIRRFIFEENQSRIKRALLRQDWVSEAQANILAHKMLMRNTPHHQMQIQMLGVVLITKESEL